MPASTRGAAVVRRAVIAIGVLAGAPVAAQRAPSAGDFRAGPGDRLAPIVANWIALDAPTGHERRATDALRATMPEWTRDALGSLVLRRGRGTPRRVVACRLDEPGYVVSEITDDGYLRLHGLGNRARAHPLWHQFHIGQRIRVVTRRGPLSGVVAVRSTHLRRGRESPDAPLPSLEDMWVDVGARSRGEAASGGIALLDPVLREWPRWTFGVDRVAGPAAAARAGCAAVVAASAATPTRGETVFVLGAQSTFGHDGLSAALAAIGGADSLLVADPALIPPDSSAAATDSPGVIVRSVALPFTPPAGGPVGSARAATARAWFAGTLAETLDERTLRALFDTVAAAAGVSRQVAAAGAATPRSTAAPPYQAPPAPGTLPDSLAAVHVLLARLTDTYGVSGHEDRVRQRVRAVLPGWASQRAVVDTAGNLVVAAGPERDTVVFVAHLDEVGFEITRIARDGTAQLRTLGGVIASLWEGQPALLHLGDRSAVRSAGCALTPETPDASETRLRGVFVPRRPAAAQGALELTAWFGADSAALVACGVQPGNAVTGVKVASRLAGTRFTARSIDDRAGSTALALALAQLDPARLARKVVFIWTTREETGLDGARAIANQLRSSPHRVHAVDTFVSSDSPLESRRFAFAPIGAGAVVRALDNSSVAPPDEVDRVVGIARAARIPIQIGTTNGGNDGSELVRYGVVDIPLSWPLRYSHSPAEVIDLVDVLSLTKLVVALAVAP